MTVWFLETDPKCYTFLEALLTGEKMVIGPSEVRALPVAAVINVGGHYNFFLSLSPSLSGLIANPPRRGWCRVLQFCMGS
jgi:hypothetical protein